MKPNFDSGLYVYYDNFFYIKEEGKFKLNEYINFLILGFSTYNFYDDFDIYKAIQSNQVKSNMLFFDFKEDSFVLD
ncbi:hypothetical protein EON71_00670 [bacterium]|nr:MAG: hypothetical protein EON71_00670 [bacterium]